MAEKSKKGFFNNFFEEDEDDEEELNEEENTSAYEEPRNQQVKSVSNAKMIIKEPRSYDDAKEVAEYLLKGKAVIVNIHKLNESSGTRLLDYLTGVSFAIRGSYQKVDNNVFLFAPSEMPVDGKIEIGE